MFAKNFNKTLSFRKPLSREEKWFLCKTKILKLRVSAFMLDIVSGCRQRRKQWCPSAITTFQSYLFDHDLHNLFM